jgi:hypothetical protein
MTPAGYLRDPPPKSWRSKTRYKPVRHKTIFTGRPSEPIDLIPDFIPVFGYLDDLILVPAGIALAIKLIPDDVLWECQENIDSLPKIKINGIYVGIVIVPIWFILIYLIIKALNFI